MRFFAIPQNVDWNWVTEIGKEQVKALKTGILKIVGNKRVEYCLIENGKLKRIEHKTKRDDKGSYDELQIGNKIIKVREEKVEIDMVLNIDEQRVLRLAEKIKQLNKKREPHAIEFARLWGKKDEKIKEIKELLPKQPIVERADDPSNPERPFYYYIAGYKDELTEEKRAKIAKLDKEIESIEEKMEQVKAKMHEIDNELKKLIEENRDIVDKIMTFFKETTEGREILYSEDPYDGYFGGEGLPEDKAIILYTEYKILKTKKVRC